MKNVIVLAELLKVYKEAKVDGFILGWTDGTDAVFSAIMIDDITEENLYIMTQGKENFRQYKRNERWLKSLMEIERIPMNELEKIEEEKQAKNILMCGPTGTGKTTFIQGFVNAFNKVKFDDKYRYRIGREKAEQSKLNKVVG